ncbi:hypothetical protein [Falsiroseomonas sp.]|uniref:hypothetical protein n=1 Tax=Falsiroseomonas sp. TaxID=2870721 RepID=UPI003F6FD8C8
MRRHLIACLALLAGLLGASTAQAQNRFWLVNDTGRVIERAYVSSSRVSDWGPDILGTSVLPPGQRVWVTPNFGDCILDLRVTYQGGGEESRMQVPATSARSSSAGPAPARGPASAGAARARRSRATRASTSSTAPA